MQYPVLSSTPYSALPPTLHNLPTPGVLITAPITIYPSAFQAKGYKKEKATFYSRCFCSLFFVHVFILPRPCPVTPLELCERSSNTTASHREYVSTREYLAGRWAFEQNEKVSFVCFHTPQSSEARRARGAYMHGGYSPCALLRLSIARPVTSTRGYFGLLRSPSENR